MDQPPPASAFPVPRNSTLAIWSLVLGIVGIVLVVVCLGPLFAIPAIICGHLAYSRIKRSSGALGGRGLALGGLIMGYVSIALSFVMIPLMAAVAIPNFVKARDKALQQVCIRNLEQIDRAKQAW